MIEQTALKTGSGRSGLLLGQLLEGPLAARCEGGDCRARRPRMRR